MNKFAVIPQEFVVVQNTKPVPYAPQQIRIRIDDEAAGPYLAIEGVDGESDEYPHCFYLSTIEEIDEFAEICKSILQQANESYWEKDND